MAKMSREFLENLGKLEKGEIDSILDAHSKSTGDIKTELETAKTDLKTVTTERDNLQVSLKERDTQLEELKKSEDNPDTLKAKITELQETNKAKEKEHASEIKSLKKEFALEKALTDAKAKNNTAVKALLDLTKIDLEEDGTIKGLEEQLKALTEADDTKFLFDNEPKTAKIEIKGAVPGEAGDSAPSTEVDLSKMSYDERDAYLKEHPEVEI